MSEHEVRAVVVPVPTRVTTAPGDVTGLLVQVTNLGPHDATYRIRLIGLDPTWWSGAVDVGPIPAGGTADVAMSVALPLGFPPGTQLLGVEAVPISSGRSGQRGRDAQPMRARLELEVAARRDVFCDLEPDAISGGVSGRFQVVIGNRSPYPTRIHLTGDGPEGELRFHFEPQEPELAPGQRLVVPARVRGNRPGFGEESRRPFTVTAHGPGEPVRAAGTFIQSPWVSAGFMKVVAILTLFALWATMLWVGLSRISDNEKDDADVRRASDAAVAVDDSGGGEGGGADAGGGAAADGGADAGAAVDGEQAAEPAGPLPFELTGVVTSDEPQGIRVLVRPVSLADGLGRAGTGSTERSAQFARGRTKVLGPFASLPSQQTSPRVTTTDDTDQNGAYGFAGLLGPGFYEVRFTKPGFETVSHIVEATEDGSPVELNVTMVAGDGAIGGLVADASGPLGGVDVTVSDGEVTYTTRTPTTGADVGRWAIEGLDTPSVWLVTLARRSFSTETALVTLPAGGSDNTVDVTMRAGVGSVSGRAVGPGVSGVEPKGGLTVTATDGTITRTTSTLTEGDVGSYLLPQLPVPGVYTVTLEGAGFLPLTTTVELTLDAPNATGVDFVLLRTTGRVSGTVVELVDDDADPDTPDVTQPLNSVGITATDGATILKTTSADDGVFTLDGLPPGTYVVTFSKFGFADASATVAVAAGDDILVNDAGLIILERDPPSPPPPTGTLTGSVTDASTGQPLSGVLVTIEDAACDDITTPDRREDQEDPPRPCQDETLDGAFSITGAPAGGFTVLFGRNEFVGDTRFVQIPASTPVSLNIALVPFGSVFGILTADINRDGQTEPIAAVAVKVTQIATGTVFVETTTDANGVYDTGRVFGPAIPPLNLYSFEFRRAGVIDRVVNSMQVDPGQRLDLSLQLLRSPEILGTVLDGVPPADPNTGGLPRFDGATATLTGPGANPPRTATTDSDGFYSFYLCDATTGAALTEGIPGDGSPPPAGATDCMPDGGHFTVTFTANTYTPEVTAFDVVGGDARIVNAALFQTPVRTTGRVFWIDGEIERPINGASVSVTGVSDVTFDPASLQFTWTPRQYFTATDVDGVFTIPRVSPPSPDPVPLFFTGAAVVTATNFFQGASEDPLTPGNCNATGPPPTCNQIPLQPRPGSIQGLVVSNPNFGQFLDGLDVTVIGPDGQPCCENQFFQPNLGSTFVRIFDVPAGTYELQFDLPDTFATYEPVRTEVLVSPGLNTDFGTAEMRITSQLEVDVNDNASQPVGEPLPGATVTVDPPSGSGNVTNGAAALGELHPFDLGYTFTLTALTSPISGASVTLNPSGLTGTTDGNGQFVGTVPGRGQYTATVLDSGGDPIVDGTLAFDPDVLGGPTDQDGKVSIGVLPLLAYDVGVTLDHYVAADVDVPGVPPAADIPVNVDLDRLNRITGRVIDGSEAPLDAAVVSVTPATDATVTRQPDANGNYDVDVVASATVTVTASLDGHAPASEVVAFTGLNERVTVDLTLRRLVDVTIEVRGLPSTYMPPPGPVRGATVTLTHPDDPRAAKTTKKSGDVTFTDLQAGLEYTLQIDHPDFASQTTLVTVSSASDSQTETRTLGRLNTVTGRITVRNTNPEEPLKGVTVTAVQTPTLLTATSKADGTYRIEGLGTGVWTLAVTAIPPGYENPLPSSQNVNFDALDQVDSTGNDFTLRTTSLELVPAPPPAPGVIAGSVSGAGGDGLGAVTVTAVSLGGDAVTTRTADDGSFALGDLAPSVWEVTYTATGYSPLTVIEEVRSGTTTETRVVLSARGNAVSGSVSGRNANDAAAQPLDGASVTLLDGSGAEVARAVAAEGRYSFQHIEDGSYTVLFEHSGHESARQPVVLAGRDRAVVDGSLVARNGRLTVTVVSASGDPVGGASVRLTSTQLEGGRTAVTAADGTAVFDGLPPAGDYTVEVDGAAGDRTVTVAPGQLDAAVTVTAAAPASVTGMVTVDGIARDGIELALYVDADEREDDDSEADAAPSASTFSGGDGRAGGYRFDGLTAGTSYRIVVFVAGAPSTERTFTAVAGDTTVDIAIPPERPPD